MVNKAAITVDINKTSMLSPPTRVAACHYLTFPSSNLYVYGRAGYGFMTVTDKTQGKQIWSEGRLSPDWDTRLPDMEDKAHVVCRPCNVCLREVFSLFSKQKKTKYIYIDGIRHYYQAITLRYPVNTNNFKEQI